MSKITDEHPSKDILAAYALGEEDNNVTSHISSCTECQEYIAEVKSISSVIEKFPEEDVPVNLQDKILKSIDRKGSSWFEFNSTKRIINPFLISLGLIGLTILFYVFIVFLL